MDVPPTFFELFFAIVPLFFVGMLGFYFRKHGGMCVHADATILWLLLNLFAPCLIIDSFLGNASLDNLGNLLVAPLLGFGTVVVGLVCTRVVGRFLHFSESGQQGTFDLSVALYNYGYIPIPIILLFFGKDVLGMLFVYNVGMELSLWTLGLLALTGHTLPQGELEEGHQPAAHRRPRLFSCQRLFSRKPPSVKPGAADSYDRPGDDPRGSSARGGDHL